MVRDTLSISNLFHKISNDKDTIEKEMEKPTTLIPQFLQF